MTDKKKILVVEVVEDSKELLTALSDKLTHSGYDVATFSNGKTGLDWALENHPDIILLDLQMPIMDGKKMLERLRQDKWGAKARVVVLSNSSDNSTVYDVIGATSPLSSANGLNDFFIKADTSLEEIVEHIKSRLSQ